MTEKGPKVAKNGHSDHSRPQDVTRIDSEMLLDYKTFKIEIFAIFGPFCPFLVIFDSLGVPPYWPLGDRKITEIGPNEAKIGIPAH